MRHSGRADLPDLLALEEACWSAPLRAPAAALEARIADHPAQHFVLELDGQVVGVVYTQRMASIDSLRAARFDDLTSLAVADGPVMQLLGMNVLPQLQDRGLGDELLDFVLVSCSGVPGRGDGRRHYALSRLASAQTDAIGRLSRTHRLRWTRF